MTEKLLHTPVGVRDTYGIECAKKQAIINKLHQVMHIYGYQDIETPTFEYSEVFDLETGSVDPKETYRFFNRDNNLVVLRPDITPSIARAVSKYYADIKVPVRLCYIGSTFRNKQNYLGKMNEVTQVGAELIGDSSADADAELIAILIRTMLQAGLTEFQVDLGEADFFKGLMEEADLEADVEEQVKNLIEEKNFFGVDNLLSELNVSAELKETFKRLPEFFGSLEKLQMAKEFINNRKALKAVKRLEEVYEILSIYGYEKYITFDLGMVHKLDYYTGVIFSVHTYGLGAHIGVGGRYDKLIEQFGDSRPAIGFAINIGDLIVALNRQMIEIEVETASTLILYNKCMRKEAISLAESFRADGVKVELQIEDDFKLDDYQDIIEKIRIAGILHIKKNEIEVIDVSTGVVTITTFENLIGGAN